MDPQAMVRWLALFLGILLTILIADALSGRIILITGLNGWPAFIGDTVLFAAFVFALICLLKRYGGIDFFRLDHD